MSKGTCPLSTWTEECSLAARYIKPTKGMHFISEQLIISRFLKSLHLFFLFLSFFSFHPKNFRSLESTNPPPFSIHFLFPKHSTAFWLLRATLVPNIHENVTVCLKPFTEFVSLNCRGMTGGRQNVPHNQTDHGSCLNQKLWQSRNTFSSTPLKFSCALVCCGYFF